MKSRSVLVFAIALAATLAGGCGRREGTPAGTGSRPAPAPAESRPATPATVKPANSGRVNVVSTTGSDERLSVSPEIAGAWEEQGSGAPPSLLAGRAKAAPKLDGSLDDACWREAKATGDFQKLQSVPVEAGKWVSVRAVYDAEALYLGATLAKPGKELLTSVKNAGGRVWVDDALEVFLVHSERRIPCQVDVNAIGTLYTGTTVPKEEWKANVTAAASIGEKEWNVEIRIPWADLGIKNPGTATLPLQLRYIVNGQSGSVAWAPGRASEPGGMLIFRPEDAPDHMARAGRFRFPRQMPTGSGTVAVEAENPGTSSRKVLVRLQDPATGQVEAQETVDLRPGERRAVELKVQVPERGRIIRALSFRDTEFDRGGGSGWQFSETRGIEPMARFRISLDRELAWFGDQAATGVLDVGVDAATGSKGNLTLQFWDRNHVLAEKKISPAAPGRYPFTLGLANLPAGTYRAAATFRGPGGVEEASIDLQLREGTPLPERKKVRLLANWTEEFNGDQAAPLYAAVAFPGGMLLDPENLRVVDGRGNEVPCQHEVLARWGPEGSIRWLALHFPGRRSEAYSVEFGSQVHRQASKGPAVTVKDGGDAFTVDTGAARFELPKKGPLVGKAWLGEKQVLAGDTPCLLLADQDGAVADETRAEAGEAPVVEVAGPFVTIVRREGFYRKKNGDRLGKYVVRLKFTAGSSLVAIQHTFVVTEDSNKVQYSDLALRFRPSFGGPWKVALDDTPAHDAKAWTGTIDPSAGDGAYLFQAVNRHHGLSEARFEVGQRKGKGAWEKAREGETAGEWGAVSGAGAGVAVTMRNLARLFPKEIEAGPDGLTAHLWSSRGGRKLDYRVATVIEYLGKEWVDKACRRGLQPYQGGYESIKGIYTNAAGSSRTHDLALHLFGGATEEAAQAATLADQPALVVQDPQWLFETDAVGPLSPCDPKANPRQEKYLQAYFREVLVGVANRLDNGFLDYGSGPHTYSNTGGGDPRNPECYPLFYRFSHMDYGFRTVAWWLYARSGERMYHDYAAAMNRHIGDFHFSRWETRDKPLGAMISGGHAEETPFYWSGTGGREKWGGLSGHQGVELNNHLYHYYLTGDRAALDGVRAFGETFARLFDPTVLPNIGASSDECVPLLFAAELYRATWDVRFARLLAESRDRLLDLRTTNGLANREYCGNYAKVSTHLMPVVRDWEATGCRFTARVLEKACRQEILGNGPPNHGAPAATMGYHDFSGLFAWAGLRITSDPRYASWIQERVGRTVARYSDAEGNLRWFPGREAPYDGPWAPTFLGSIAYGLGVVAEAPKPLALLPAVTTDGDVWLVKEADREVSIFMEFQPGFDLRLANIPKAPEHQTRDYHTGPVQLDLFPMYYARQRDGLAAGNGLATIPIEAIPGEYRLSNAAVLATTASQVVSASAEGTFLRVESLPPRKWYFQLPKGKKGAIYATAAVSLNDGGSKREIPAGVWVDLEGGRQDRLVQVTAERTAFVRFRGDLPPVFAENSADRFFLPKDAPAAAPLAELEKPESLFVPGITGGAGDQALLLNGARGLTLPFGNRKDDGSYERFSQTRGTLEFWFKPQWTSRLELKERMIRFFEEGMWGLLYKIEPGAINRLVFTVPVAENLKGHQHLARVPFEFEQGRWYHLALCWDTLPDRGWIGEMYLDGQGYNDGKSAGLGRFAEGEHKAWFTTPWHAAALRRPLTLPGEFNAVVDEVRGSDLPRYPKPFDPIKRAPFESDEHTTFLLRLDGNVASAAGKPGTPTVEATLVK